MDQLQSGERRGNFKVNTRGLSNTHLSNWNFSQSGSKPDYSNMLSSHKSCDKILIRDGGYIRTEQLGSSDGFCSGDKRVAVDEKGDKRVAVDKKGAGTNERGGLGFYKWIHYPKKQAAACKKSKSPVRDIKRDLKNNQEKLRTGMKDLLKSNGVTPMQERLIAF